VRPPSRLSKSVSGVGGDAKLTNKIAHTVKLSLAPIFDGKPVTPLIAGDAVVLKD